MSDVEDRNARKVKGEAFDALVKEYYRRLYNYVRKLTHCPTLAEDVTQEAFIRAYRYYDLYDRKRSFMAWISRIAHNIYIDTTRKRNIASIPLESIGGENTGLGNDLCDPETLCMEETIDERLQQGLKSLPPPLQTAIILCDVHGWSYEEIGIAMRCSPGTTRSRIHRARQRLRKDLSAKGWETPQRLLSMECASA